MKKHADKQLTVTDPVCGMEVSYKTAIEEFKYKGRTYYFCAGICREKFEADPEQYLRPHRQHGLR
jgi:YHS domain-containing protein